MMTDPIADLFARIRNSVQVKQDKIELPNSKIKTRIAEILKEEGFIKNFRVFKDEKQGTLRVYFKYLNEEPAIRGIRRVSRPGRRVYVKQDKLPKVLNGLGIAIISTSQGVCTCVDLGGRRIIKKKMGELW